LGEFTVGASLVLAATQSIKEGYPLKMVIPAHGAGHEIGASALMAGAKNKADAKRVLDWMVSPEAAALYGKFKEIVTIPGHKLSAELVQAGLPADITKALYPVDFEKSTSQKAAITEQWRKSFNR
jgi:iron(III) transport system substrate-binding protein